MNNYLSVLMIQLQTKCNCDSTNEFVADTTEFKSQIEKSFELIRQLRCRLPLEGMVAL